MHDVPRHKFIECHTMDKMTLDEARQKLRAAKLADFTRVRGELAKELKEQGDPHLGRLLMSEKKPSSAEWAVAQVDDELKEEVERTRREAEHAQAKESGDALREALAAYRAAVNAAIDAAKTAMREADMAVNAATERAIRAAVEGHREDPLEALAKK